MAQIVNEISVLVTFMMINWYPENPIVYLGTEKIINDASYHF